MPLEPGQDTDPRAERVRLEIFSRMPPWRKMQLLGEACRTNRVLLELGLRKRYPDASTAEIERRLRGLLLGESLAERVYGPVGSRVDHGL